MKKVGALGIILFFLIVLGLFVSAATPLQYHPWSEVVPGIVDFISGVGNAYVTQGNYTGSMFIIENLENNTNVSLFPTAVTLNVTGRNARGIVIDTRTAYTGIFGGADNPIGIKVTSTTGTTNGDPQGVNAFAAGDISAIGVYGEGYANGPSTPQTAYGVRGKANKNSPTDGVTYGVFGETLNPAAGEEHDYYGVYSEGTFAVKGNTHSGYNWSTIGDMYTCLIPFTEQNCTAVCAQHGFNNDALKNEPGQCLAALNNKCIFLGPPVTIYACWRNDSPAFPQPVNCNSTCQDINLHAPDKPEVIACYCAR